MLEVKRLIQITLYVLVLISSLLLGMSMESTRMVTIGVVGATLGFLITDCFKLFRIEGFLANVASIVILFLAMKDFFSVDNAGKLVSVANLLVYLQTVLMFQEKTPRLNWQVLVLSLLQVVVSAIFSLNLEAGLLFLLYFVVVGVAMILQSIYTDAVDIKRRNRVSAFQLKNHSLTESPDERDTLINRPLTRPLTFFDSHQRSQSTIRPMVLHLLLWIGVSTIFTSILFYMVPRHAKPWFGPANVQVRTTGGNKAVDLDERGVIAQSNSLVFRVSFEDASTGEALPLAGQAPYFRGLALSSLVIEDGKTNWRAPHDRVFQEVFQELPYSPQTNGTLVNQTITMSETADPLIYGLMPFYRAAKTPKEISFCHEISALTRGKPQETIGMAPYKYTAETLIDRRGQFSRAWPYISNTKTFTQRPISHDPPQRQWLTQMDSQRYPTLATAAEKIGESCRAAKRTRLEMLREMESFFLNPTEFSYTLDFRKVVRDEALDPIEDFFRNHRSGHCELYASALTLMLRHQDIPTRLVVGFYGAEFNNLSGNYLVRAKHAHAWVEAYLRPEDCTEEMFSTGQAGPGGAWLILDPTPLSELSVEGSVGDEAIDLARKVWDDYVLGMESRSTENSEVLSLPMFAFLNDLDIEKWDSRLRSAAGATRSQVFKYLAAGLVMLLFLAFWVRAQFKASPNRGTKRVGVLRRVFAGAISFISPGLGQWVMDRSTRGNPTGFYLKLQNILLCYELERAPSQTHREFASEVSTKFESHPSAKLIRSTVHEVTEIFNEVRFGQQQLDRELTEQIDLSLNELSSALKQSVPGSV
ncbi:MAG: DUF3488 and transglutaminase-like domain-containing protein [Mariniblastus sp.]|nr:DUF3488 and transglutaminase-like domain-containing protein [Mariniblastus sp.]